MAVTSSDVRFLDVYSVFRCRMKRSQVLCAGRSAAPHRARSSRTFKSDPALGFFSHATFDSALTCTTGSMDSSCSSSPPPEPDVPNDQPGIGDEHSACIINALRPVAFPQRENSGHAVNIVHYSWL